ncbi:CDP-glycerol glycerophosphotransferase family protein [Pseudomonas entomophila]|uniref:CDP-glycerol glycerophosphotransferase family protein n=1 Tax=Pseudomonas entomophila TaxID=312306 RepID=UPI0023D887F7|nr:CDP-glycerol glycerophosphotransferase family protein [Pseudomonas entomophila]MDF0731918.1 CDP-glycerol glycerophosphotransferase family protein [Pseudomonas entomophila]
MHNDTPVTGKRRIAILYQLPESWGNVRTLWEAARDDADIEVTVVMLPFIHNDYQWKRETCEAHLNESGVPFVAWDAFELQDARFDAVIYTSPYDETRPPAYRFANLRQQVGCTAYIPYGLEVGGGAHNYVYQYGQPVIAGATAVFVRSEGVREMFARHCPSGAGHVHVTGHPRMDGLANLEAFPVDPALRQAIGDRQAVLWNAHFSIDGDFWSTFDVLAADIFEAFAQRPELALIFRPHPLLWKKLSNLNILDAAGIDALKQALQARGVIIDEHTDHRHAFAASDALLSDVGSFLMEYLATGKPVLYLHNPHGLGLNEEGRSVVRHYQSASSATEVAHFLDQLRSGEDQLGERRRAAIEEFFHGFDGQAGQRALNVLKDLMA